MGERVDLDMEVLKQVRDEVHGHRARFDALEGRMDSLEGRMEALEHKLDHGLDSLGRRIVESEMRTATAITALSGQVGDLAQMLKEDRNLRHRVERCESDIAVIRGKLPK